MICWEEGIGGEMFFFFRKEAPVIFSWDGRAFCLLACVRDSTEQLPTNLKPWSEWSCETYIGKQHALVRRSWLEQIKWSYTWFNSVKKNGHRRWPPGFMDKSPDTCRSGDKGERLRDRSWVVATTGGGLGLVQRSTVECGLRPSRRIRVLVTVRTVVLRCRAWPIEVPVVSSRLSSGTTTPRPGTTRWMSPERNEWLRWEKVVHKGEKERGEWEKVGAPEKISFDWNRKSMFGGITCPPGFKCLHLRLFIVLMLDDILSGQVNYGDFIDIKIYRLSLYMSVGVSIYRVSLCVFIWASVPSNIWNREYEVLCSNKVMVSVWIEHRY